MKPFKGKDKAKADGNRIWAPKRGNSRDKDEDLDRDFQNVGLNPKQDDDCVDGRRDSASSSVSNGTDSSNSMLLLPRRPEAENCLIFLRTGSCRFGLDCKYNHPAVKRTYRVDKGTGNKKGPQGSSKKYSDITCKFYETNGGCRNGEYCRFNHSKPVSENALNEIKSSEEEECSFYIAREEECSFHMNREEEFSSDMHTSSCGYRACFSFHNSDPNNVENSDPYGSVINSESVGCYGEVSEFKDSDTLPMHLSESAHAYGFSPLIAYYNAPYADDCYSYMPMTYLDTKGLHQNLGWNSTQLQRCSQCAWLLTADNFIEPEGQPKQDEQFPKAQGQPVDEEDHHKAPSAKQDPCVLNDVGLPLRPGKQICWHYKNLGLCKFGRACAFDHPMKKPSTQSDPSKAGIEFHI